MLKHDKQLEVETYLWRYLFSSNAVLQTVKQTQRKSGTFSEAKVEPRVITLMEFESHLKFKRDVRYQSVLDGKRQKGKSVL